MDTSINALINSDKVFNKQEEDLGAHGYAAKEFNDGELVDAESDFTSDESAEPAESDEE